MVKILTDSNGVIVPSVSEATTVKGAIDAAYLAIPVEVLPTASIAVGQDAFRTYVLALSTLNLYHYNRSRRTNGSLYSWHNYQSLWFNLV